eukprot:gnl/TRDRNA2_/TRDRNA2_83665_c0_seq1.p1 gnl/TRDRNA2_/TRDRNA2_83665_c0~~gnl/TRDRNA2_/TRDRNA2_83665_c0_seq1.p1  ORF type:complete len:119 (+),score=19.75 gnl/TRDRNA2_/TRDRNA2_83665_c0_seq1:40-396(+)
MVRTFSIGGLGNLLKASPAQLPGKLIGFIKEMAVTFHVAGSGLPQPLPHCMSVLACRFFRDLHVEVMSPVVAKDDVREAVDVGAVVLAPVVVSLLSSTVEEHLVQIEVVPNFRSRVFS